MSDTSPVYRDITLSISPRSVVFPGDPPVAVESFSCVQEDGCNTSQIRFSLHTGTHLDAPLHLIDGAPGVDGVDLDVLIGPAQVLDFGDWPRGIDANQLAQRWVDGTERVLLKTGSSRLLSAGIFSDEFGYVQVDAADFLIRSGVRLVGIDAISIDGMTAADLPVHRRLLEAGITIVEALVLEDVPSGAYELICLPIKVEADGAPVRAVLVECPAQRQT